MQLVDGTAGFERPHSPRHLFHPLHSPSLLFFPPPPGAADTSFPIYIRPFLSRIPPHPNQGCGGTDAAGGGLEVPFVGVWKASRPVLHVSGCTAYIMYCLFNSECRHPAGPNNASPRRLILSRMRLGARGTPHCIHHLLPKESAADGSLKAECPSFPYALLAAPHAHPSPIVPPPAGTAPMAPLHCTLRRSRAP